MCIALWIIGGLAAIITVLLLLPVKLIIKSNEQGQFMLRYQYLFMTFGKDPKPDTPVSKLLKEATGMERLKKDAVKENIRQEGLLTALKESLSMVADLLRELKRLLKHCKVSRLHIDICCAGEDADQVAIHYGQYCAAAYSLFNIVRGFVKIRKRDCKIDVGCDFMAEKSQFRYDVQIKVPTGRVLAALWRVAWMEAKRKGKKEFK